MWGEVIIGSFSLRETVVAEQNGDRLTIGGQESYPPQPRAAVTSAHDAVTAMVGSIFPVVFTDKDQLTGFYRVTEGRSDLIKRHNGEYLRADWSLVLERLGGPRDLEIESFVPRIGRATALAVLPTFWHSPAIGALDYFTGTSVPAYSFSRSGRDGVVPVHLGIPATIEPRWTVNAESYMSGAAVLRLDGRRRIGYATPPTIDTWEVENGLVRLTPGTINGEIVVECWDAAGGEWASARHWRFLTNFTILPGTPELTVIRNEPEEVIVRLTWPQTIGRLTVDLGLRRGSRFVTGLMKRHSATTLSVIGIPQDPTTAVTGGIRQTTQDAAGNRFVAGTAQTVGVTKGTDAHLRQSAVTRFDFFLGHEVGTDSLGVAQEGDDFADLLQQYLGSTAGEGIRIVRR